MAKRIFFAIMLSMMAAIGLFLFSTSATTALGNALTVVGIFCGGFFGCAPANWGMGSRLQDILGVTKWPPDPKRLFGFASIFGAATSAVMCLKQQLLGGSSTFFKGTTIRAATSPA